jgi:solute carrier family 25 uncoupling protein 27
MSLVALLLQVRLQADGQRRLFGKEPRYTGSRHALAVVWAEGGVRGMWKGYSASVNRAMIHAGVGLSSYDHIKETLMARTPLGDTSLTHGLSSLCSSLLSTSCSTPMDVIKTRMMNQSLHAPLYTSTWACLSNTIRQEGALSLWKGFLPAYCRTFPWQFCFFLTYEQLGKHLLGGTI